MGMRMSSLESHPSPGAMVQLPNPQQMSLLPQGVFPLPVVPVPAGAALSRRVLACSSKGSVTPEPYQPTRHPPQSPASKGVNIAAPTHRKGFVVSRSVAQVSHRRSEVTPARWPGRCPAPEEEQPGLQRPVQGITKTSLEGRSPSQVPQVTTSHVFCLEPKNGSFFFYFPAFAFLLL